MGSEQPSEETDGLLSPFGSTRRGEYWEWFAVALFLLLTVDLLTSMSAAVVVGTTAEANPLMAWVLSQSLWLIVSIHLLAAVGAAFAFETIVRLADRKADDSPFAIGVEIWLGSLVAIGLFLLANNLSVIVHGSSLL
ncbi:MAG: hypothetical protein ACQETB_12720 [Halobacteriota archaeon]